MFPPISQTINAYCTTNDMADRHSSEYSWLHCHRQFQKAITGGSPEDRDRAAVQLGFYLASWGMFRKGFLRWRAYTIHSGVIDKLLEPRLSMLSLDAFQAGDSRTNLVPLMLDAIGVIREAYRPFAASDLLVTKVLLGTFCCLPANDSYFRVAFRHCGLGPSSLREAFITTVFDFCKDNLTEIRDAQLWIDQEFGVQYPIMKIVDMYFWQTGRDLAAQL